MPEKVIVFDTTLRDGEQSPGASMNVKQKLELARQLARLGVDVIEAGFPISSPGDAEAVRIVAEEVRRPVICGLARAVRKDIDVCWKSVRDARRPRLHTFIMTSDIQIRSQLKKTHREVLKMTEEAVALARSLCEDVEFSTMDATRSGFSFLRDVLTVAIEMGASTINIPDTVGYATPEEFGCLIRRVRQEVPGASDVVISVHCHNDLGLATANSLAAVRHGARQVECTVNGVGERAGNASLEEIVMTLRTRGQQFGVTTGIETKEIMRTSQLVSRLTGIPVQPNKAIVGSNAFAHESGIHQDGVLKSRQTFEIMKPETVGLKESRIVLGPRSGRHALSHRLAQLGYQLTQAQLAKTYERFKRVADKKKEVYDEDLAAIVEDEIATVPEIYRLEYFHTASGNQTVPTATVRLKKERAVFQEASCGDGPVDAMYRAMDRITGRPLRLEEYSLRAVTAGKDALGEVSVKVRRREDIAVGRGTSTDIIEASAKAYVNAVNKLLFMEKRRVRKRETQKTKGRRRKR